MPKVSKTAKKQLTPQSRKSSAKPTMAPPSPERIAKVINLIEIRPNLFLNVDHIVSVRVLSQEEGNVHAVLQLSNGDKQNLTREEFTAITGEEPRLPTRLPQKPYAEEKV